MTFRLPYKGSCRHLRKPGALPVEAHEVCLSYPGQRGFAVEGFSALVQPGQRVGLLGPNGSGKSTFLKAAAGLLPLRSGSLTLFGQAPGSCQHQVVYLAQRSNLDWEFPITVRRLVLTGAYVRLGWLRYASAQDYKAVDALLHTFDLESVADKQIGQLSGGQQQRALIARTLMHDADLLLLDEPLNAVDAETQALLLRVFDEIKQEGRTVLMSTHDTALSLNYFDACIRMGAGVGQGGAEGQGAPLHAPGTRSWT